MNVHLTVDPALKTFSARAGAGLAPLAFYQRRATMVAGAAGFVGRHCLQALHNLSSHVTALTSLPASLRAPSAQLALRTLSGDVCDHTFLRAALSEAQPSLIFHLAALTPASQPTPSAAAMLHTNALGTLALLESTHAVLPQAQVLIFSSSAVYGAARNHPVSEDEGLAPINDYGASKAAQELVAAAFSRQHALPVIRVRTFNLTGPGEPPGLVCAALARQIARAELGFAPPVVQVGDLDARRDFTDVRDAVAAYLLIGAHGCAGEIYNVCSARTVMIGEVLERLLALAEVKLKVVRRDETSRGGGRVHALCGSYERLHAATGWQPRIPLGESLRHLLDWWRADLKRAKSAQDMSAQESEGR